MKRIFIDTEFSDLVDLDLISLALIDEDGRELYCERDDFDRALCSAFVVANVIPQLTRPGGRVFSKAGLAAEVSAWLAPYALGGAQLCYRDFVDVALLSHLLGSRLPGWMRTHCLKYIVTEAEVLAAQQALGGRAHFAFDDACALRSAYLRKKTCI